MDEVELTRKHRAGERCGVTRGIGRGNTRASRPGNQMTGSSRVRMGEDGNVVTTCRQPAYQHIHDPLDAAIVKRRHWQFGVGGDSYAQ